MVLQDAQIYFEGINNGCDFKEQIQQIVKAVKALYPSSELNMRLIKNDQSYEALLWGKSNGVPFGIYNRGQTLRHVLDTLFRSVKRETLQIWKVGCGNSIPPSKNLFATTPQLAVAS